MAFGKEIDATSEPPYVKCPISGECGGYRSVAVTCNFTGGMENGKPYCGILVEYKNTERIRNF